MLYQKIHLCRIEAYLAHPFRQILNLYRILVGTQTEQFLIGHVNMKIISVNLPEMTQTNLKRDLHLGRESAQHLVGRKVNGTSTVFSV